MTDEKAIRDIFTRTWITSKAKQVLSTYSEGITIRQLYYRLVAQGMTNDVQHYKRVVAAMTEARWEGEVRMIAFLDRERSMFGKTLAEEKELSSSIREAKKQIGLWMKSYNLERWSNQPNYVEVWIEKKALQGVFEGPCRDLGVGLAPCKGYPSLTFLNEAAQRIAAATEDKPDLEDVVILYFGDYDPSGEDIPRSLEENLRRMGLGVLTVKRIALNPAQIREMNLPGAPPKKTDSRTANWSGSSVVELDAVEPDILKDMVRESIEDHYDTEKGEELDERARTEKEEFQAQLKEYVKTL